MSKIAPPDPAPPARAPVDQRYNDRDFKTKLEPNSPCAPSVETDAFKYPEKTGLK
jgi:hypothetical protein